MRAPDQTRSPWMSYFLPDAPPLVTDARCGVCVVGAGIAGMTTAYLLAKKGKQVMVIDGGSIGGGMSSRSAAHLTTAIDDRYHRIERLHGAEGARLAAQSHAAAIDAIEAIAKHESISCDLERVDGYLFLPPRGDPDELLREYEAALRAGVEGLEWAACAPVPGIDTGPCLRFPRQGQFHPLKYMAGLARAIRRLGGTIHCGVLAQAIEGGDKPCVHTKDGQRIDCDALVVATHEPIQDLKVPAQQAPYTNYAIAAHVPRGSVGKALYWDTLDPCHCVRLMDRQGEVLIVGGESHPERPDEAGEPRFAALELWMRERFPVAGEVLHRWSAHVMEPVDCLAYIGRVPGEENVYVVTGDSGMGMTHGTIAGLVITDLVHGAAVPWAALYSPSRAIAKTARDPGREAAEAAWRYMDRSVPATPGRAPGDRAGGDFPPVEISETLRVNPSVASRERPPAAPP